MIGFVTIIWYPINTVKPQLPEVNINYFASYILKFIK